MDFDTLRARLPDPAKDLRLNLGSIERTETLTPSQLWGTVLASALASRQGDVIGAAIVETRRRLDEPTIDAVRTSAALMAMTNVYYRFRHAVEDAGYADVHARLRMQGLATHGAPPEAFEAWSLAVSAINGCAACTNAHERELRRRGVSREAINDVIRISSIVAAVAAVMDHEKAMAAT